MAPDAPPPAAATPASGLRLWVQFWTAGAVLCLLSLAVLGPPAADLLTLGAVAVAVAAATGVVALTFGPQSRWRHLVPVFVGFGALALIGLVTRGLAPAVSGFYVVTFIYVGLTQRPGTTLRLLPLAAPCWLITNAPVDEAVLARLPVAVGLWLIIGEILSRVVAERAADKALLARRATEDALTGLRNRHGLDDHLGALEPGDTVVFVDLDHFKQVNDQRGHDAGDRVLADLGRVILALCRPGDVAIRYGGEEVLLLVHAAPLATVAHLLERLRVAWAAVHPELTFSAGVAAVDDDGGSSAVTRADRALYVAKARGRDRTEYDAAAAPYGSRAVSGRVTAESLATS